MSLKKPVQDAENTKKKTFPCPCNSDPLSCYQTLVTLMKWIPDAEHCEASEGGRRLFRRKASAKQIAKWKAEGRDWCLSPHSSMCIGVNTINPKLKQMAKWCGFDNAENCTSHGNRRAGISKYANSGCGPAVLKQAGGHASLQMVATYHKPNQDAFDAAICCKAGSPTAIRKQVAVVRLMSMILLLATIDAHLLRLTPIFVAFASFFIYFSGQFQSFPATSDAQQHRLFFLD